VPARDRLPLCGDCLTLLLEHLRAFWGGMLGRRRDSSSLSARRGEAVRTAPGTSVLDAARALSPCTRAWLLRCLGVGAAQA
jgi:hypothetical protein